MGRPYGKGPPKRQNAKMPTKGGQALPSNKAKLLCNTSTRPNLKGLPKFRASCAQRPSFASRQALLASQTGGLTHPLEPP